MYSMFLNEYFYDLILNWGPMYLMIAFNKSTSIFNYNGLLLIYVLDAENFVFMFVMICDLWDPLSPYTYHFFRLSSYTQSSNFSECKACYFYNGYIRCTLSQKEKITAGNCFFFRWKLLITKTKSPHTCRHFEKKINHNLLW